MLINLRNALMTGKRLPYDAEVEYLESSGTQYIDTLVNADSNLSVEITMANAGTPWSDVNPMGAILVTPRARHHLNLLNTGICYYFCTETTATVTSIKPSDGEVFTFKVDAIAKTLSVNSSTFLLPNDTFDLGMTYWLFGRNGTTPPYLGKFRICSAKLWSGATLVRDYIPVRKKTVGYLYDRVSGKLFGNAGSGDFQYGPDVVPVEYIESHGTEWIDTGVVGGSSSKVEIVASSSNTSANYALLGARDSSGYLNSFTVWQCANNRPRFDFTASTADIVWAASGSWNTSGYNSIAKDGPLNTLNGIPCTSNTEKTFSCNFPFYLFAVNTNGTNVSNFVGRMKTCRIFSDSIPVRSFLPVRVGTDATSWEGAMMDTLTRRIYRNVGTGAFSYGNDLKYPIPAE